MTGHDGLRARKSTHNGEEGKEAIVEDNLQEKPKRKIRTTGKTPDGFGKYPCEPLANTIGLVQHRSSTGTGAPLANA